MTVLELHSEEETRELGRALARVLRAGDLVILDGPLGAGKTVLAQGIGAALGVRGEVTSPTFVIARVHQPGDTMRLPLVHVDAYRLGGIAEIDDLDLDTDLEHAVTVVEWGEGVAERLADQHLLIRLRRRDDEVRTCELVGVGGDWPERLAASLPFLRPGPAGQVG